jgi:4-diphosphocytidyl-2-C-methyl-D-erythritol kinase
MKLRAPAKVNLHLRVLGKRPDGFHELETLMVPIDLADEITVETALGGHISVTCDDETIPTDESNLAFVAARKFLQSTNLRFDVRITIEKHIPSGAGLGGGSSDAAAVLVALDTLLETRLGPEALEAIAAQVGSDVPFFVRGRAAVCRGRGERMDPAPAIPATHLVLIKPAFAVETAWAYKKWSAARELPRVPYGAQDVGWTTVVNDLERPVFEKFLLLPVIKTWLCSQPDVFAAGMSGSGSTMFALPRNDANVDDLAARARSMFGDSTWIRPSSVLASND